MKAALNRFMSLLGYVPYSATNLGSFTFEVDGPSVDAAIAKLAQLQRAAIDAEEAMNSAAAMADFGANDLCAESGRDLVLAEVRAQGAQIAKVLKMLDAQQRGFAGGASEALDATRTSRTWFDQIAAGGGVNNSGLPG